MQIEKVSSTSKSDRLWFVLIGMRYEGPLSVAEVHNRMADGVLSSESYAWRSGMDDWLPIAAIAEFKDRAQHLPAVALTELEEFQGWNSNLDFVEPEPTASADESASTSTSAAASKPPTVAVITTPDLRIADTQNLDGTLAPQSQEAEAPYAFPTAPPPAEMSWSRFRSSIESYDLDSLLRDRQRKTEPPFWQWKKSKHGKLLSTFAVGAVFIAGVWISGHALTRSLSGSSNLEIGELTVDENRELQSAVAQRLGRGGTASIAMARSDAYAPFFYIGTNLPHGSVLEVQIDGVPGTLLDRFRVSTRLTAIVKDGIAKTPVFRSESGIPYPRGEYRLSVTCRSCEAALARETVAQKTFFIGGLRDADYESKLKDYHDRLRAQAVDELNEIKQVADTLENQLTETASQFENVMVIRASASKINRPSRVWPEFHATWTRLDRQLEALFSRWSAESLENSYFHANLYAQVKLAGDRVRQAHQAQTDYLLASHENTEARAKIDPATNEAFAILKALKAKVALAESLPNQKSGLPQKP